MALIIKDFFWAEYTAQFLLNTENSQYSIFVFANLVSDYLKLDILSYLINTAISMTSSVYDKLIVLALMLFQGSNDV